MQSITELIALIETKFIYFIRVAVVLLFASLLDHSHLGLAQDVQRVFAQLVLGVFKALGSLLELLAIWFAKAGSIFFHAICGVNAEPAALDLDGARYVRHTRHVPFDFEKETRGTRYIARIPRRSVHLKDVNIVAVELQETFLQLIFLERLLRFFESPLTLLLSCLGLFLYLRSFL